MTKTVLICLFTFFVIVSGCKKETITGPTEPQDLISNVSFELNGNPSIDGWIYWSNVDSMVQFSNDVPNGGGNWSVHLRVGDRVVKFLQTKIAAPTGRNRFRISVWARRGLMEAGGSPSVAVLSLNDTTRKILNVQDTTWGYYEAFDTIDTVIGDSLTVRLGDGYLSETYFDLCRLQLLK